MAIDMPCVGGGTPAALFREVISVDLSFPELLCLPPRMASKQEQQLPILVSDLEVTAEAYFDVVFRRRGGSKALGWTEVDGWCLVSAVGGWKKVNWNPRIQIFGGKREASAETSGRKGSPRSQRKCFKTMVLLQRNHNKQSFQLLCILLVPLQGASLITSPSPVVSAPSRPKTFLRATQEDDLHDSDDEVPVKPYRNRSMAWTLRYRKLNPYERARARVISFGHRSKADWDEAVSSGQLG